ncbi:putative lipoprotein [Leptospira yanagawae serovar Saopaulo str. Sao Paulo = ATCC 700523]|uniref:Putative lipoprotein n=1 Tax=Leptospira yanagawae serovar Saopaulo str. Sao Paulo = ATCC 700523 TaxID=1249483 RepID=A0A5E8HCB6_9LEPT|nr:hypothetical protein [Leptospira yanagawae]EOQ89091.1 putative lipoprotein [Leptospira yanagawae serovar Saopaulo str. Sao Paulo = ATCC 700523]
MLRFPSIIIPFFLFLFSCSIADLRPPSLSSNRVDPELKKKGLTFVTSPTIKELTPGDWKDYKQVQFVVKDVWHSKFVRFFTPIKESEQRMRVYLDFETNSMQVEFLGGEKKGLIYGLDKKETYYIAADTGKVFMGDDEVRIYLESLRLYLTLPWRLKEFPIIQYAGTTKKLEQNYEVVYFTSVQLNANPDTDQYVGYFETTSGALEWMEFTYRELFSFYRGVLKYGFYESWNGKQYPRRITILDKFEDSDFVHEIRIEKIEIPEKPMEEVDKVLELPGIQN